jgi:hypothetical protein
LEFDTAKLGATARTFISCENPPLATIDPARMRAQSASTWGGLWLPGSRYLSMDTGHDPMVSAPQALTRHLLDSAV